MILKFPVLLVLALSEMLIRIIGIFHFRNRELPFPQLFRNWSIKFFVDLGLAHLGGSNKVLYLP